MAGLAGITTISFGLVAQEDCSQPASRYKVFKNSYGMLLNRIQHDAHVNAIMDWCTHNATSQADAMRAGRIEVRDVEAPRSVFAHLATGFGFGYPLSVKEEQYAELDFMINCRAGQYIYSVSAIIEGEISGQSDGLSFNLTGKRVGGMRTISLRGEQASRVICYCCL